MLGKVSAQREAWKRERAELEAEERRAFYAQGGVCYACRDTGLAVGALNTPCTGEGGQRCAAGDRLVLERAGRFAMESLDAMGLPPRRRKQSFETFPLPDQPGYREVYDFVSEWDGASGLLLVGRKGRGKTGLLVSALRAIAEREALRGQRLRATFTSAGDLLEQLRDGYRDGQHSQHMARLQRVPLLGIDDLGVEKPTEWVLDRLFLLLNARYEANLPTFVTTNHNLATLRARVGMRAVDRLLETCEPIAVGGVNLRSWLRGDTTDGDEGDDGDA